MNKILRGILLWIILFTVVIAVYQSISSPKEGPVEFNFSQLVDKIMAGDVKEIKIIGDRHVEGKFIDRESQTEKSFTSYIPNSSFILNLWYNMKVDPATDQQVEDMTIQTLPAPQQPWWVMYLPNILFVIVMAVLFFIFLNQMQSGGNRAISFGKSRARLHMDDKKRVTFEDVAGVDEAKEELQEVVEFLKQPKKFAELGARIPKGILLVGPPGTGKTLLGRAVAGEAGVPFFSISGSDFVEMFVGVGAARVRDLFEQAKKNAPCIVFVDEIDAVGRQRGAGLGGGHDEREQTLNQLLVEMDGFETNTGIIILAATNRPDVLDPALLRPGRFDRQVVVDIPDVDGREAILKVHARNKPLSKDVNLKVLARRTPGFTGADLENVLNEAALLAARRGVKRIRMIDTEDAIERVLMGPEKKNRIISEKEKKITAVHEAGHALVAHLIPDADPVHKVTIIPRGRVGGFTLTLPEEDRSYITKAHLMSKLAVLMGGRVAEEIVLNEISSGAKGDIENATEMARNMVTKLGMSEELGPISYGRSNGDHIFLGREIAQEKDYSEEIAATIDREIKKIIEEAYSRAKELLLANTESLNKIVDALIEKETLDKEEFEALLENGAGVAGESTDDAKVADENIADVGIADENNTDAGVNDANTTERSITDANIAGSRGTDVNSTDSASNDVGDDGLGGTDE